MFDSGIGGLTVVRELLRREPNASFVYVGDTARTPYGNKTPETLIRYSIEIVEFLRSQGATSIVIACNSASAAATTALRERYPGLPIFDVITPSIQDALLTTRGRLGVIGTRATIASRTHEHLLATERRTKVCNIETWFQACPLFVPLVEEGWLDTDETRAIVHRYLEPLRRAHIDTLILACTHYPLIQPLIQKYMGRDCAMIDPAVAVVTRLLEHGGIDLKGGRQNFFLTDVSVHSERIAREWLRRDMSFAHVSLPQELVVNV